MDEKESITLKKSDLWKYSTIVLLAIIIVWGFVSFTNSSGNAVANTGNNANAGNNQGNAGTGATANADLSSFLNNPNLYPSLGPQNAKDVVIEFSDFQCPYCALASGLPSWTSQYASQYGDLIGSAGKVEEMAQKGDLRFIYVSMSFLGDESIYASQAALCANKQSKFWEMHDALFIAHDMKENNGKFTKDNLKKIAQKVSGLNIQTFNKCLDGDETLGDVQTISNEASKAASGTPTFYVNGQNIPASWTQISSALK